MTCPHECQHYDGEEGFCWKLDTWEVVCAGCLAFQPRHIAPPEPPEDDKRPEETP